MEERLAKETAKKIMEIKGEARGITIKTDWRVILRQRGPDGLKKVERRMAELGWPLEYEEIKTVDFYPIGYDALSLLVIKEVFDLNDRQMEELGAAGVKISLFFKILLNYFVSLKALFGQVPKFWRKHYTVGDFEVSEFNEEEKYVVFRLKNFALHPTFCATLRGIFSKTMEIALNVRAVCRETKCVFKGDKHHELLLKWEQKK